MVTLETLKKYNYEIDYDKMIAYREGFVPLVLTEVKPSLYKVAYLVFSSVEDDSRRIFSDEDIVEEE